MRASPLARILLAVYVALAAYASLPPLQGWRDHGLSAFAHLGAPWPRYVTRLPAPSAGERGGRRRRGGARGAPRAVAARARAAQAAAHRMVRARGRGRPRARAARAVAVHAALPDHAAVRLGRPEGSLRRAPGAAARAAGLRRP